MKYKKGTIFTCPNHMKGVLEMYCVLEVNNKRYLIHQIDQDGNSVRNPFWDYGLPHDKALSKLQLTLLCIKSPGFAVFLESLKRGPDEK